MGIVHLNGPDAGVADRACVFCLMAAKQTQWETYQDDIKAGLAAPGDKVVFIPWPSGLDKTLMPGDYTAVPGDAPQMGLVPRLCWDHVAGMGQRLNRGLDVADGPLPPGLLKGRK